MSRASTPTLLSLDKYAALMGVNPSHFNQGAPANIMPVDRNACSDVWFQYSWQWADSVSREDLAHAIADAESDIAEALGWFPAPLWLTEEVQQYPRHHRPDVIQAGMKDVRGYQKGLNTRWGNVIGPGRRGLDEVGVPNAVSHDLVTGVSTVTTGTAFTDVRQVKVYTEGQRGAREWEIRPARTKAISAGTFTATFWTWQMIDPDLWEALTTTDDAAAIDWTQAANLVTTVDVYREFNDTTQVSAQMFWEPLPQGLCIIPTVCSCGGTGCIACALTTQNGCLHVRDAAAGVVVPQIATYDTDDAQWESVCATTCRNPDFVKLWYYAGLLDTNFLASNTNDPLSHWWAQTIAWLATARLERPFCSCANVTSLAQQLRTNLALIGSDSSFVVSESDLGNPFGMRAGEIMAWRRVRKLAKKRGKVAVV